jgi:hypothetical protein
MRATKPRSAARTTWDLAHQLYNPLPLDHMLVCDSILKRFQISFVAKYKTFRPATAAAEARSASPAAARWTVAWPGRPGPPAQ